MKQSQTKKPFSWVIPKARSMGSTALKLTCACMGLGLSSLTIAAAKPVPRQPEADFQIVESVPEATFYGEPGVPRTQAVWLQMIRSARKSIDVAAFYIADKPGGGALSPVLDALAERAAAGVAVRVLVDHTFLKSNQEGVDRLRQVPGITIRVLPVDELTGGVLHAKYMVIDDEAVFIGSQNWDWRALEQIHEIGARIRNERFAKTVEASFEFDWQLAGHPDLPKAAQAAQASPDFTPVTEDNPVVLQDGGSSPLTAFPAFSPSSLMPAWVSSEEGALIHMIDASQHVLRIQVMTLSAIKQYGAKGWWSSLDTAIRDASARGVDVRIIVGDWSLTEPAQSYLKSLASLPNITVKFSRVPPSPSGFIPYARVEHAKYAVADDDQSFIGTGNWEWSYFHNTVDVSVRVNGKSAASTLTSIFDRDWSGGYVTTIVPGQSYQPPRTH